MSARTSCCRHKLPPYAAAGASQELLHAARATADASLRVSSGKLVRAAARWAKTWRAGAATAGLLRRGGAETAGWVGSGGRGGDRRRHRASAIAGLLRRQGQDEHGTGLLPFRILYFIISTGPYILIFMDGIYELKNKKATVGSRISRLLLLAPASPNAVHIPGAHAAGG